MVAQNNTKMVELKTLKKTFDSSINRTFSEKFKKDMVQKIERNVYSVREVSDLYEVSRTSVYNWVYKYSVLYQKGYKQIIEPMSDTKKIKDLQAQIKELERAVGMKQIKIDFLEKMIEISEEDFGIDIKKKASKLKSGSGKTNTK